MGIELTQRAHSTRRFRVSWRPILIIIASGACLGLLTFSIALSHDAKLRVYGMVEVARAYAVDANGSISSDFVLDPGLVVRTVNANERRHSRADDSAGQDAKVQAVARLSRGGSLVEIETVSDSLSAAENRIQQILEAIKKQAEPMRASALGRLSVLDSESLAEMRRLGEWRDKLNPMQTIRSKSGSEVSDSLNMIAMGMIRADTERHLHEIQTQRRAYLTAMHLMEERKTRLVVPVFVETSSPTASIALGLGGLFVGALAASAVFFVRRQPLISIA